MGCHARKPVFWVSDKARLKPVPELQRLAKKNQKLLVASLDILTNRRITKVLIRLCMQMSRLVCAFVVRKHGRQVFSCRGQMIQTFTYQFNCFSNSTLGQIWLNISICLNFKKLILAGSDVCLIYHWLEVSHLLKVDQSQV